MNYSHSVTKLFSWEGFSLEIPIDWKHDENFLEDGIKYFQFKFQNLASMKLSWEWQNSTTSCSKLKTDCQSTNEQLCRKSKSTELITSQETGWKISHHKFIDNSETINGYFADSALGLYCFIELHFSRGLEKEKILNIRNLIFDSFKISDKSNITTWIAPLIHINIPTLFKMKNFKEHEDFTSLILEFENRKLTIFGFPYIPETTPIEYEKQAVNFLNMQPPFKGINFSFSPNKEIITKRKTILPFSTNELGNMCFKYIIKAVKLNNIISIAVFNYRNQADLKLFTEVQF